eukprot:CAMPEP_0170765168 /NCGR_PEP_ID=MMETSP0733-20121128/4444_1 /TAXON_ID=186038 /ORGANISM="Fragilariopsis kerguelensis, Strain L26-C5" /LENGTH=198 /DNA_ID=CAMNT_0011105967 /DNA_START=131 /DNA_END=728 /DNA_ORIENTATION=-
MWCGAVEVTVTVSPYSCGGYYDDYYYRTTTTTTTTEINGSDTTSSFHAVPGILLLIPIALSLLAGGGGGSTRRIRARAAESSSNSKARGRTEECGGGGGGGKRAGRILNLVGAEGEFDTVMGVHQSYYHHPAEPEQESVCVGWSTPPPQSAEKEEEEGTDGTNVDDETRSSASDGDVDCFHPNYSVPFGRSRSDPIGE